MSLEGHDQPQTERESAAVVEERSLSPRRVRLIGRALARIVTHAPVLWPILRGPVSGYFDGRAQDWDERTGAPGAAHLAPLALGVTKIDRRPERALDLGTGTGVAALFLAREFPQASIRGIDVSEEMIRRAQAKVGLDPEGRIAFRVGDAASLPWPDEHFDLVTQLNMPPFFAETARVMRHGAHLVVAASSGERTPFHTPDQALDRGFRRHGLVAVSSGAIGAGTYWVARKDA